MTDTDLQFKYNQLWEERQTLDSERLDELKGLQDKILKSQKDLEEMFVDAREAHNTIDAQQAELSTLRAERYELELTEIDAIPSEIVLELAEKEREILFMETDRFELEAKIRHLTEELATFPVQNEKMKLLVQKIESGQDGELRSLNRLIEEKYKELSSIQNLINSGPETDEEAGQLQDEEKRFQDEIKDLEHAYNERIQKLKLYLNVRVV